MDRQLAASPKPSSQEFKESKGGEVRLDKSGQNGSGRRRGGFRAMKVIMSATIYR
jgi:hypothetical protein